MSSTSLYSRPSEEAPRAIARTGRGRLLIAIPVVAVAALMAPMVLTARTFGIDWSGHLWLVSMQARNIEALGHPSLFIQSGLGAFYAWFAFYGATLYSLAGGLSVLSGGHTTVAYIACFALAFTMSYGGFWWIASQAGIDGWRAHVVPLLFVTSAYFLTDAYARGAWPETMAVSTIPLVAASGSSLLRGKRLRSCVTLIFLGSATLLTGSHNITLLLSSIFFVLPPRPRWRTCLSLPVCTGCDDATLFGESTSWPRPWSSAISCTAGLVTSRAVSSDACRPPPR